MTEQTIVVPDIGGASGVSVIDILVKPGDAVSKDDSLITLESEKASMDIPSPYAGVVKSVLKKVGDKVNEGDAFITLTLVEDGAKTSEPKVEKEAETKELAPEKIIETPKPAPEEAPLNQEKEPAVISQSESSDDEMSILAAPGVRRMARELGVNLVAVKGSGRKSRVTKEDIDAYVKETLKKANGQQVQGGLMLSAAPDIDFSRFGDIDIQPLNKIKRLTGQNVHRSWITIPHVTQFDEADITELEAFRKAQSALSEKDGVKLTLLAFITKVVTKALQIFPQFNASLDSAGTSLIYKKYYHIGIAVDTPNGLVVPVIKNVDKLSVVDIAKEMTRLSAKARDKGLSIAEMSGACFTLSSLGGISGTAFTPIVNAPEVAILGLSRSSIKPVYDGKNFIPRLMLPLSLSYDHRVIDGAEAARFTRYLSAALSDIRTILL